jgi:ATP-dependent DNA helicase RecG
MYVSFEGDEAPYFADGRGYVRSADESLVMQPKELKDYFARHQSVVSQWDSEASDISIANIDESVLRAYIKRANETGRISWNCTSTPEVLERLGLLNDGVPVNAAKVLFSTKPDLTVQMATFASEKKLTFTDIRQDSGTVFELVNRAERYIKDVMHWRVEFDGSPQRKEVPEVPVQALREALINSFAHRLWGQSQNNEVAIYKDRIEIYNPGRFPDGVKPAGYIKQVVEPIQRNPLLAKILYYSQDIEHFGTGLIRIDDACKSAGVRYKFKQIVYGFTVIFYRPKDLSLDPVSGKAVDKTGSTSTTTEVVDKVVEVVDTLSASQRELYELLAADPRLTTVELGERLGISQQAVSKRLHGLKEKGVIIREGSDRKGSWVVVDQDNRDGKA